MSANLQQLDSPVHTLLSTRYATHEEIALENLVAQFTCKPNIEKLLKIPMQELEKVGVDVRDLQTSISIETAEGVRLDQIGKLLGRNRSLAQSDTDYRVDLITQTLINQCHGTQREILCILQREIDSDLVKDVQVEDHLYAHVTAYVRDVEKAKEFGGPKFVDSLCGAGIGSDIYVLDNTCTEAFGFDGDPNDLGYSSIYDASDSGCMVGLYNKDANADLNPFVHEDGEVWGYGSIYNTDESEEEGQYVSLIVSTDPRWMEHVFPPEFMILESGSDILLENEGKIKKEIST